jgi:hypothetical protein
MNLKLILKTLFLIAILSLLVLMGMYNRQDVKLWLPPTLAKAGKMSKAIEQEAAIMYFGFFAVGVLTGTILTAGGGGKKGSKTSKVEK